MSHLGLDDAERAEFIMKNPEFLGALTEGLAGLDKLDEAIAAVDRAINRANLDGGRWCSA